MRENGGNLIHSKQTIATLLCKPALLHNVTVLVTEYKTTTRGILHDLLRDGKMGDIIPKYR